MGKYLKDRLILVIALLGLIICQIDGENKSDTVATDVGKATLTGILNIASKKMMELAKLAMHLTPIESESFDVKVLPIVPTKAAKSHIIFTAWTNNPTASNSNLNYTKSNATDGNPVNASSGIYTVKTPGLYGFIFHAVTNDVKTVVPTIQLRVNNKTIATAAAYNGGSFKAMTLIAGAKLNRTDQVAIFVSEGPLFGNDDQSSKNRASFAGTFMN